MYFQTCNHFAASAFACKLLQHFATSRLKFFEHREVGVFIGSHLRLRLGDCGQGGSDTGSHYIGFHTTSGVGGLVKLALPKIVAVQFL